MGETRAQRRGTRFRALLALAVAAWFVLWSTALGSADPATAAGPPQCAQQGAGNSPTTGLVKQAHPVVLVHGWDGKPMADTRTLLERSMTSGWQFLLFDYSKVASHWASRPEVAACLADYLESVSKAHRAAGGDGKVYVVAHSMGGLATSYAANPAYGNQPDLASHLGGLTTLDTPWTGSPWGSTQYAALTQTLSNGSLPDAASDAWQCLKTVANHGAGGCSTPAYFPKGMPVAQVAGDITVRRTYFGFHAYDISLGSDTIVTDSSQHGYIGSAPGSPLGVHATMSTVSCTPTMDSVLARAGLRLGSRGGVAGVLIGALSGTELQLLADGKAMDLVGSDQASAPLIEFLARAYVSVPCAHTKMPTNPAAITEVVAALRAQAAGPQLVPTDLLRAPIPASCQHDAGQLVNGDLPLTTPAGGPSVGFATVLSAPGQAGKFLVPPVIADLTRSGTPNLSGVLLCSAGGVSWPELILVYAPGPALLGFVDLADVVHSEHSVVTSMSASGGDLRLTWDSYEGCCFQKVTYTGTVHWDGSKFVMLDVAPPPPP